MGLDVTSANHHCRIGYGGINHWREVFWQAAGYPMAQPEDYNRELPDFKAILGRPGTSAEVNGDWEETPDEPLVVLVWHSDCDGVIWPAQAGPLAERIRELQDHAHRRFTEPDGYYRRFTAQFLECLDDAVATGEPVVFA